ncbi:hypothetical protein SLE2022_106020 [Rubroshorea leprosula]
MEFTLELGFSKSPVVPLVCSPRCLLRVRHPRIEMTVEEKRIWSSNKRRRRRRIQQSGENCGKLPWRPSWNKKSAIVFSANGRSALFYRQ